MTPVLCRVLQALDAEKAEDHRCPRLSAVRRHMAKKSLVDRAYPRLALPSQLFPVAVGRSPLHGRGVFATRDIAQGELLTLYPPDGLAHYEGGMVHCVSGAEDDHETLMMRFYAQRISDRLQLLGDPRLFDDPAYVGHLINCSVGPHGSKGVDELKASWALHNAAPVAVHTKLEVAFVATRPIEEGEEVLTYYGRGYWDNYEALGTIRVPLP
jgi:hypothetical protein